MTFAGPTGTTAPLMNASGFKAKKLPGYNRDMMQVISRLLGGLQGGGLEQGLAQQGRLASGSEEGFAPLEERTQRDFTKFLGQTGSRFSGLGAMDSSAFQNAVSGGAGDFALGLQEQRQGISERALDRLMALSERLLGDNPFQQREKTNWSSILGGLGGAALGSVGGPIGSGVGAALLPKILKAFGLG